MRIFLPFVFVMLFGCKKESNNQLYSEWVSYFDKNDYRTKYYVQNLAFDIDENLYIGSYSGKDTCSLLWINSDSLRGLKINQIPFLDEGFKYIRNGSIELWFNNHMAICHDTSALHGKYWTLGNMLNPMKSQIMQLDKNENLWRATNNGIQCFDGNVVTTFFNGHAFSGICADKQNNLSLLTGKFFKNEISHFVRNDNERFRLQRRAWFAAKPQTKPSSLPTLRNSVSP